MPADTPPTMGDRTGPYRPLQMEPQKKQAPDGWSGAEVGTGWLGRRRKRFLAAGWLLQGMNTNAAPGTVINQIGQGLP